MTREEARYYLQSSGFSEEQMNTIEQAFKPKPTDDATLRDIFCMGCEYKEQEPCEMTAEEYRQRMIQAFHNADTDELIAICVLPTEKEFEHLEWLLKNHYKNEPCGDAIDRSKAIMIASGYCHPSNVAKELAKLPAVNPTKTGWIPVSERLPEDGQYVLFCDIDNDIMVGYHVKGRPDTHFSQDGTYDDMKDVRAWMPLPEPYKPQERSDKG